MIANASEFPDDLKWLYFDIALRNTPDREQLEQELATLVRVIMRKFSSKPQRELISLASRYVDKPLLHCTTLRDHFVIRILESIAQTFDAKPKEIKKPNDFWRSTFVGAIAIAMLLYVYVNWWSAALIAVPLILVAGYRLKQNDRKILRSFQWNAIDGIASKVRKGGFDEPTIVQQLELIDLKKSAVPGRLVVNGTPIPFGTVPLIDVPDVLYSLLRLPRRNIQSEFSRTFAQFDERKREEFEIGWDKFLRQIE